MRDGSLVFVAVHGEFAVRGMEPDVAREVATFPDDVELECEGEYEDGRNIEALVVTQIVREVTRLVPLTHDETDDDVRALPLLARARAAERLGAGDVDGAAADLAYALRGRTDGADEIYALLPEHHRASLVDAFATWATVHEPRWRFLRWLPVARWTDEHLDKALTFALARGGKFGDVPAEAIVEERERRGIDTTKRAKELAKLRRAQATDGGTWIRIDTELVNAKVAGATRDTVYVSGWLELGPPPSVAPGAKRQLVHRKLPAVIAYDTEGRERARYVDVVADHVIDGIALQINKRAGTRWRPQARRLADDKVMFESSDAISMFDHELVRGTEEIRRLGTGELVARLPPGSTVWWDDEHIHVDTLPHALSRATGEPVAMSPRPRPALKLTASDGREWSPHEHNRFLGWYLFSWGKLVYVGPIDGTLVALQLARLPEAVELAPPWLAIRRKDQPIILVALGELMTCEQLRVDGTLVAKRLSK